MRYSKFYLYKFALIQTLVVTGCGDKNPTVKDTGIDKLVAREDCVDCDMRKGQNKFDLTVTVSLCF